MKPKKSRPVVAKKQSRQQRKVAYTRAKLIDAARLVFAEKGLDLATVDDITRRADAGRGTFYYHFGTKSKLIKTLVADLMAQLVDDIDKACSDKTELPETLDALVGAHIGFFAQRWEDFVLYFQGRGDLALEQSYEGLETPFIKYIQKIEKVVDDAVERPLSAKILRRLACAIAGFVSGYYSFAVIATDADDVDRSFAGLRSAFVASLVRFIKETAPNGGKAAA